MADDVVNRSRHETYVRGAPTLAYFHWRAMTVERAKFSKSGTGVIWLRMLVICSVNR
jgi:hypothetical protein